MPWVNPAMEIMFCNNASNIHNLLLVDLYFRILQVNFKQQFQALHKHPDHNSLCSLLNIMAVGGE